jgi:predicted nucleotidyltransferase
MPSTLLKLQASYPTPEHGQAARAIVDFFRAKDWVEAVLLINSCARGKATPDSDLDMAVLVRPDVMAREEELLREWDAFYASDPAFKNLRRAGEFGVVHLDFFDGRFELREQEEAAGPDWSEIEVGNRLVYNVALYQRGDYFDQIKTHWLPYYSDAQRAERLTRVEHFFSNNIAHLHMFVRRELYFQAFDRLYNAYQEFLQALFISKRTYPIAYNKWIREQIVDLLGLPDLYTRLTHLLEIVPFESTAVSDKANELQQLFETHVVA